MPPKFTDFAPFASSEMFQIGKILLPVCWERRRPHQTNQDRPSLWPNPHFYRTSDAFESYPFTGLK
ncbi:MAG: hypothetical protein AAF939_15360, partial [Planctomycetota bacterium]